MPKKNPRCPALGTTSLTQHSFPSRRTSPKGACNKAHPLDHVSLCSLDFIGDKKKNLTFGAETQEEIEPLLWHGSSLLLSSRLGLLSLSLQTSLEARCGECSLVPNPSPGCPVLIAAASGQPPSGHLVAPLVPRNQETSPFCGNYLPFQTTTQHTGEGTPSSVP